MQIHKDIHEAKLAVMGDVEYVQKTGEMTQGFRYKYVTVDEVIAKLRPSMVDHGIHFAPTKMDILHQEQYTTAKGAVMNRVLLGVSYRLSHVSGTSEDGYSVGEGTDSGDKACNKAMTAAKKYALLQSFCLETGEDDPDHHSSEEQERKPKAKANGKPSGKADHGAVHCEEYKGKVMGLGSKQLVDKLINFDEKADTAAEHFGSKDRVAEMREVTVKRLYVMLDADIISLTTIPTCAAWAAWRAKHADKYLAQEQVDLLDAKLAKREERINEDLAKVST